MKSETKIQTDKAENQNDNFCRFDAVVGLPTINVNEITLGDSLELCERIPAKTVDLILEDMPYNTTACEWDVKIDLELYWKTRLRILKPTGVIVLTGSQPFTTDLINSNRKMFKYEWIWDKGVATNIFSAEKVPLKYHENILVFGGNKTNYFPLKVKRRKPKDYSGCNKIYRGNAVYGVKETSHKRELLTETYPASILDFNAQEGELNNTLRMHNTQKPVGLFEYLIRTYTNENDLVFDGFGGSGTTAVACHKSKRNFIVIEKEQKYFDLATRRLANERTQLSLL